jgi:DNA-binding response OmpR family regulator
MKNINLMVLEDDPGVAKLLTNYLSGEGYAVAMVDTLAKMKEAFGGQAPEVMIMDVVLPDGDGWEALRWVRERSQLPVMMLAGKDETIDKVAGLELGADDYLGKPFELRELLARLRTIQRRQAETNESTTADVAANGTIKVRGIEIDTKGMEVRDASGASIKLTQAECRILIILARNSGIVVSRETLMEQVAGRGWDPNDRSMDVHVSNLRKKLEGRAGSPDIIRTVRGVGYMLVATDD